MLPFASLPNLGTTELMVIAFVSLLIFGNRLPSLLGSLGESVTEFKKGIWGTDDELDQAVNADKVIIAATAVAAWVVIRTLTDGIPNLSR